MNPLCIIGAHPDVLKDVDSLLKAEWDFMAIGLDAVDKYLGHVLYVATFHPVEIPAIRERRRSAGGNVDYRVISHENQPGVDVIIMDWWRPSGSSALLGTQAALRIGYKNIVLCGCPMTGQNSQGSKYDSFQSGWKARQKEVAPFVRSMSGWTRDFLGSPTSEWLKGET